MKEESTTIAIVQNIDQKYVPTPVLFSTVGRRASNGNNYYMA